MTIGISEISSEEVALSPNWKHFSVWYLVTLSFQSPTSALPTNAPTGPRLSSSVWERAAFRIWNWRLRLTVETCVENVLVGQRTMEVLQQSRDICEILFLVPQVIAAVRAGRCLLWRNYNRLHIATWLRFSFRIWLLLSMFWQRDILHILHNSSIKWNLSVLSLNSLYDRSGPIVHLVGILFWKLTGGAIQILKFADRI